METRNSIIEATTKQYLSTCNRNDPPSCVEKDLLEMINDYIILENSTRSKYIEKIKPPSTLPARTVADIILDRYPVVRLSLEAGSEILAMYCDSGKNEGLYIPAEDEVKKIAEQYNHTMSERELKDVVSKLERNAPLVDITRDPDLIPVNNGVFNYRTKDLRPFTPKAVFTSKAHVDYKYNVKNPIIRNPDGTDWDVDNWMNSLSDDPGIVHLLWEIIGACVRSNVNWKKSAWLYGEEGNGGKGTLCKLIRNICGEKSCASISVEDFGTDAFLEGLVSKSAIICDENDVGTYLDKAKKFKCAVTGDPISVNRKYRSTITFTFHGFIIQCINELPKVKDISGSFSRRLLIVPMEKCFTGQERPYIKDDYLVRDEVLEYVLYKVLNMNYYTLSEPEACRKLVAVYNESNNPVVEFWNEFASQFTWDLLPSHFLFDLYISWHGKFYPSGKPLGYNKFCREIRKLVRNNPEWEAKDYSIYTGTRMDAYEPLIAKFDLKEWQDPSYKGLDEKKKFRPRVIESQYRGLVRVASIITCGGAEDDKNDEEVKP